ncbi:hypothetical protein PQQ72_24505 [Paraburkholderia strydomiana]|uniref:hypothetical protein n=1 Tax=Paraburkholderia strydomiana TaxID=1245417 RepID=UPI0038B88D5E
MSAFPDATALPETWSRLGVSICQAILEAHGGMIATSPSPYGGAGFTFSLTMEFPAPLQFVMATAINNCAMPVNH